MAADNIHATDAVDHDCGTTMMKWTAWLVVTVVYKSVQSPVIGEQYVLEKEPASQYTQ